MGEKPVLLVLTSTYPRWPGDPEPGFVHELARRLTERFRVVVLGPHAPGARPRETLDGVEVVRYCYAPGRWETLVNDGGVVTNLRAHKWKLALVPGFVLSQAWHALRLCRKYDVHVIHAHWLLPQGLIAALVRRFGRGQPAFVVTSHGADLYALRGRLLQAVKRKVIDAATSVTVVSRAMREELGRMGVDSAHVEVLPMGVDLESFSDHRCCSSRDQDEILFVGRLVEKKGVQVLLHAMSRVLKERPTVRLTIVGFGPEEAQLRQLSSSLALGAAVHFAGPMRQEDLPALYQRAAVFAAPFVTASSGDQEGLGLVVLEAIACGCPVVVSALPAVRDVLDPVQDAPLLVTPGNADELATALLRVLSTPEEATARADRLRRRVLGRFDWGSIAARYQDLLLAAGHVA